MAPPARHSDPASGDEPPGADPASFEHFYSDPHRAQTVTVGFTFNLVSTPMVLGLDTFDLLRQAGADIGPVAVDARERVRRIGFLLAPGPFDDALGWWCRHVGREAGLRCADTGDVVVLPALRAAHANPLMWLVSPEHARSGWTRPAELLSALRHAVVLDMPGHG
jgi:hypothetical protein